MARDRKPDDQPEADKPLGRDERVSFYPMEPADVLRKLLRTPPAQRRGRQEPPDDDEPAGG